MDYRRLGGSGLKVSPLCLGTMMFGSWGNTDEGECARMIQRALDAGIQFIDTANIYSGGESEEIVGRALAGRRRRRSRGGHRRAGTAGLLSPVRW